MTQQLEKITNAFNLMSNENVAYCKNLKDTQFSNISLENRLFDANDKEKLLKVELGELNKNITAIKSDHSNKIKKMSNFYNNKFTNKCEHLIENKHKFNEIINELKVKNTVEDQNINNKITELNEIKQSKQEIISNLEKDILKYKNNIRKLTNKYDNN